MTSIITRRTLLRGMFATPAIVAASSLMPLRGIVMPVDLGILPKDEFLRVVRAAAAIKPAPALTINGKRYYAIPMHPSWNVPLASWQKTALTR